MLAISIQQPWSWAILNVGKDIENRSWPTAVRGRVLVHAGKKIDKEGIEDLADMGITSCPHYSLLTTGGIVGSVEIVNCVRCSESVWFVGPWGFVLSNPQPEAWRPYRGQLGFFNVEDE